MNAVPSPRLTSRRDFLRRTSIISATLSTVAATASRVPAAAAAAPGDEIITMSATKLAALIRAKKISATEAVEAYMKR